MQSAARNGKDGIHDSSAAGQQRRAAWALNTLAHAVLIAPDGHSLRPDLVRSWECNVRYYRAKYVDGTSYTSSTGSTTTFGTANVSPQGWFGLYGGSSLYGTPGGVNAWFDAAFMHNYLILVWGVTSDYELPISTSARADHVAVRNHGYKAVVGRAGDGSAYNWRRFIAYSYPIAADSTGQPVETWYTFAQSYAAYCAGFSLNSSLPATEGTTLKAHSGDADLVYGTSSQPYGASAMMALALAKDHGAIGAADGWRRISTASNFHGSFDPYFNGETPAFGVIPRS